MAGPAALIVAQIVESSIAKDSVTVAPGAISVIRHKFRVVCPVDCVCVALHVADLYNSLLKYLCFYIIESMVFEIFSHGESISFL